MTAGSIGRVVGRLLVCCVFTIGGAVSEKKSVLIIIDVQNCFLTGGTMPVQDGNQVIPVINRIREKFGERFSLVVFSQDWHCRDHVSFASQHLGKQPFSQVVLDYDVTGHLCWGPNVDNVHAINCTSVAHAVEQTLWPDHCVMQTSDAAFSQQLIRRPDDVIIQKGDSCEIDSYSVFYDNGGFSQTRLYSVLQQHGITDIYITGLALDYCVYYTAIDARKLHYVTYTVLDATRGISEQTVAAAKKNMTEQGVHLITSGDLDGLLRTNGNIPPNSSVWLLLNLAGMSAALASFL